MKIPYPFIPLRAETENLQHTVHVIERDYTIGKDGILTSIRSQGIELLASPMRIILTEDGEEANWDMDYPANESESFIQHRSDEEIVICGAKQSDRFIVDVCYRIDYDGCIDMDFKLMTRGKTVAQVFGIAFAVNISASPVDSVTLSFPEDVTSAYDTMQKHDTGFTFAIEPYGCRILFVK